MFLYFVMVKPALRRAFPPPAPAAALPSPDEPLMFERTSKAKKKNRPAMAAFENDKHKFERNLEFARSIARQDPKIVATVVKSWVSNER